MPTCEYCGGHFPKGGAHSTHERNCDERPESGSDDVEETALIDGEDVTEPEVDDADGGEDENVLAFEEDEFEDMLETVRVEAYLQFIHRPREDTPLKNGYDGERMVGIPDELSTILNEYIDRHRHDKHDEHGRRPLFTSEVGRGSQNATRAWMYLATVPCLHGPCPHGNERDSCEFLTYSKSSQCPSSRSPHQVRTGSVTWQLNRGMPLEVVAERVNTSVRVLKRHYDQPTKKEELEERRRHHLNRLSFDEGGDLP